MYEWQCTNCGHQLDGYLHGKPDLCPECGGTDFKRLSGEPIDDRKENEHDFDYLAGKG